MKFGDAIADGENVAQAKSHDLIPGGTSRAVYICEYDLAPFCEALAHQSKLAERKGLSSISA